MKFKLESLDTKDEKCFECRKPAQFEMFLSGKNIEMDAAVCAECHINDFKRYFERVTKDSK